LYVQNRDFIFFDPNPFVRILRNGVYLSKYTHKGFKGIKSVFWANKNLTFLNHRQKTSGIPMRTDFLSTK
jgi:hypothetical protein